MARKRVLVVDDSKSARVILSRMLEKYDIEVDMAEAAENAIDYLQHNRPDAIFMDHLMPGMDGLQAVQAIKSNPRTAMIPIMMYTSQEGELYVGQARALGAMGVLPKQVRPVYVSKVLYELHLLPDRRDFAEPALVPVEIEAGAPVEKKPAPPAAPGMDWGKRLEAVVKDQAVDIRRFMVASLDSFASRIVSDLREALPQPTAAGPAEPPPSRSLPWALGLGFGAAVLLAAAFAVSWYFTRVDLAQTRAEIAALSASNTELQRARVDLNSTVKDLTTALSNANGSAALGAGFVGTAPPTPSSGTRVEAVPYGEIPFDRSRLEALRDFLGKLEAQGFRGVVHISNATGSFCLSGNASDGFAPAAAGLPAAKCDLVGNPFQESLSGQQQQSLAFANLIAGVRQRTSGNILVAMDGSGGAHNVAPYPARTDTLTAGEWNRVAAANNRVEFSAESAGSP